LPIQTPPAKNDRMPLTDTELLSILSHLQATMVSVATGGAQIGQVQHEFRERFDEAATALAARGIDNTIPFRELWDWYGHWRASDMKTYQSRREYISSIFGPLAARVRGGGGREFEPTGWERVDRTVQKGRERLTAAREEEDFQGVGLLCREALITLGQVVWVAERHPPVDGVVPSDTDAKRRLEAYIAVELGTNANEQARKHAKAALDLAVGLQHKRSATWRDAAMCLEATASVVRLVTIVEGRRDPG
jgi:hypothetical protein